MNESSSAPELQISHWLNTQGPPPTLEGLKGRVVYLMAFQMLCPGCVSHGLPQASRVRALFPEEDLAVIALHTVFEHHAVQGTLEALRVFSHEYRLRIPLGVDRPDPDAPIPHTMRAYNMQGTPTTILIDRAGNLRMNQFGHLDDLQLGVALGQLIGEAAAAGDIRATSGGDEETRDALCDDQGCPAPG